MKDLDLDLISCTHYWIIETAHGKVSQGICSKCGIYKFFENSITGDKGINWKPGNGYIW